LEAATADVFDGDDAEARLREDEIDFTVEARA
jgi:hypothetical protein